MRPKVSLDVTAVPAQPAGAGRYVVELTKHLTARRQIDLKVIARRGDAQRWHDFGPAEVAAVAPQARPLRLAWEQLRLPGVVNALDVQVHHSPHYTMPERCHVPTVVTVHDMTLFDHPEWHERSKVMLFQRAVRTAIEKAAALIAVSSDTARRLQRRFGDLNVTVIPHGVDHELFNTTNTASDSALLMQFGIPQRYIAFVGTIEPRKDLPTLLSAFDRIAPRMPDTYLVLAGGHGWGDKEFRRRLGVMQHKSRVLQTGFLPDAVVAALLRNAQVVAYPSLLEGFGLPALEAMACGAPLITTSGSAMEEVTGGAAVLISPGDVEALADEIDKLMHDDVEANRLREAGPKVASAYTWDACAEAHEAVYRAVIN